MKVYIAGPMSGLPNFNRDRFNEVSRLVVESGNTPLNPIASMDERDVLMDSLPGTVAMRLFKAASRLNGLTAGGTDDIKKS
ncbi:DUF4406 domain-containing protein [Salmonella enterica]|nr:DUF4406 domain-containing protein [Salmonella enterica]EEJ1963948.1 DUF4406 domain-containing protein [Salmonella enterica]EIE0340597.1 DUF4406 domain-containing protein [Salmonella enterica]ELR9968592.1 DUF4406 domain-containing protein [Salmonella enterica]